MFFPSTRMRRLRAQQWVRDIVAESSLCPTDLILPVFVTDGKREAIATLPGVFRLQVKEVVALAREAYDLGIKMLALFPVVPKDLKSAEGEEAYNKDNLICRAVREIKSAVPEIGIMVDVALDPYTTHGHDGIVHNKKVLNDETVAALVQQSLTLAEAGADAVAPSDMMDGRVAAIRDAFEDMGFHDKLIISYAAKYASNFYGPFRDAVASKISGDKIDKSSYQMDFRNAKEALLECALDEHEGADMLIVKPGMPYLDIIAQVSKESRLPVVAYQVSGEYAMIKFAAEKQVFSYPDAMIESLTAFKRAGCSAIISYAAMDVAKILAEN